MSRLIKAEWYRIRHSSNLFMWMIFICVIVAIIPMVSDLACFQKTLSENIQAYKEVGGLFVHLFIGIMISVSIGINYYNKTAYYEIMDGHSIKNIILSKVIVNASVMTVGIIITCSIYFTIIYMMNGIGEYDNILLRLVLLALIIMHICVASILLAMCIHHIAGALLIVLRFNVFEVIFALAFSQFLGQEGNNVDRYLDWLISSQFQKVVSAKIDNNLIIYIILSVIVESVILYFISYYSFKVRKKLL